MTASVQLGPFEVGERIGAGGMGAVYRAEHTETGEPVAVKTLLAEVARRPEKRRAFRREVQALAKLDHPGIAAIVDYGELDDETAERGPEAFAAGAPWFAMEFVDGRELPKSGLEFEWSAIESILSSTLDALAHAHARSVVHRDLKPGNMLLSDAGDRPTVKLVDFGIAQIFDPVSGGTESASGRERVTGTPKYMAPEQIRGDWRDQGPWTDLYALGCLTWRLVCGGAPFTGDTTEDVLKGHVREAPEGFDPVIAVPEGLEEWLRGLLRKPVDHRVRRAADAAWGLAQLGEPQGGRSTREGDEETVASTLAAGPTLGTISGPTVVDAVAPRDGTEETAESTGAWNGPTREPSEAPVDGQQYGPPPLPPDWKRERGDRKAAVLPETGLELFGLRDIPVVDRKSERDRLWSTIREVHRDETPRLTVLEGPAGTGKTRLAEWFGRRIDETGAARVLRATHSRSSGPDDGMRGLLQGAFRTEDLSRRDVFQRVLERLPERGPNDRMHTADARGLTELIRPTDDADQRVDGPRYRFSSAGQKYGLLRRFFERMALRRPVIVWLDDLQWGRGAIGVCEELFGDVGAASPVGVVATVRSDVVAEDSSLERRLRRLYERADARRVEIESLRPGDHRELIDRLLDLSPHLVGRLAERTEGNPLFAVELLRHWVERDQLRPGAEGFELADDRAFEIPGSVDQLWLERLEQLAGRAEATDDGTWRALELAAVLGRDVDVEEWEGVLRAAGVERPEGLVEQLVGRGLAERTARGWSFGHGLLVETLQRRSRRAGRWEEQNRICAEVLGSSAGDAELGTRERIAEHWVEAGEPDRALEPLLRELEQCRARAADEERRRLLDRRAELLDAVGVPAGDERRLEQRLEEAALTAHRRDLNRATELTAEVWEELGDDQDRLRAKCARLRGSLEERTRNWNDAQNWMEKSLEASRRLGDPALESRALRKLGWFLLRQAEFDRAEQRLRKAIGRAEEAQDVHRKLRGERVRAVLMQARGDERAEKLFERVRREAAEEGFPALEARALNGLGEEARYAGRFDEARESFREYLRKMEELVRPHSAATARLNLAQVALQSGDPEEALEHLRGARDLYETLGAEDRWEGLRHLIRMGCAAADRDRGRFDRLWERIDAGLPEEWYVVKDVPWVLESAADYAVEADWDERARDVLELAAGLWEELEDEEAADRVRERLQEM